MGQMHIQRAIELEEGPATIVAVDRDRERLAQLEERLLPLATSRCRQLVTIDTPDLAPEVVQEASGGRGAEVVIVTVPLAEVMAGAAALMAGDGMLVLFAGVPNGTLGPVDLSKVYLHGAQFTGTSGSRIADQQRVLDKTAKGELSLEGSLGAVGGMEAAREGIEALIEGRFAGKIVIFPQLRGLPLLGLAELAERYPEIGALMGPAHSWTKGAEAELFATFWKR
jgi:threonine dehydrogenase-like Zn-dependent dehydrogenase